MEYTSRKPSPVRMYCSRIALQRILFSANMMKRKKGPEEAGLPVFFLTSSIEDVEQRYFVVDDTLLAV